MKNLIILTTMLATQNVFADLSDKDLQNLDNSLQVADEKIQNCDIASEITAVRSAQSADGFLSALSVVATNVESQESVAITITLQDKIDGKVDPTTKAIQENALNIYNDSLSLIDENGRYSLFISSNGKSISCK